MPALPAIADMTSWLEMISPSSRLSLREVLGKFSEPMKILARPVPKMSPDAVTVEEAPAWAAFGA